MVSDAACCKECSETCAKRPPLGAKKSGLCIIDRWPPFAGSMHWSNAKLSTKRWFTEKGKKIISNVQNVKKLKWVFCLRTSWLAVQLLICRGTLQKRQFWIVMGSLYAGKTGRRCAKNPVAGRPRQVVTSIRSAVFAWNCPCPKKRSFKSGRRSGRWSQVLLYAEFVRLFATPYKEIYGKSPVCGTSIWLDWGTWKLSDCTLSILSTLLVVPNKNHIMYRISSEVAVWYLEYKPRRSRGWYSRYQTDHRRRYPT